MERKSYGVKTVRDGQTGIEKENKWSNLLKSKLKMNFI